jgi:hypothetical protein
MKKQLSVLELQNLKSSIANLAAEAYQYSSWTPEFSRNNIVDTMYTYTEKYTTNLDFNQVELEDLGFQVWDEESNLMLIPLWLLPFISNGVELTSISGDTATVGTDDIDNDVRFGCIAFGVYANDRSDA